MSETLFDDGQRVRKLRVVREGTNRFIIKVDDEDSEYIIEAQRRGQGRLQMRYGSSLYKCVLAKEGNDRFVFVGGKIHKLKRVEKKVGVAATEEPSESDLTSPMPGKIVKIFVSPGDSVNAKDELLIVEAMKMENRILAPFAGIVEKVHFSEGNQVRQGDILIDLKRLDEIVEENKLITK